MSNLVHNEQTKMLAIFNNLGVVSLATGFLAPVMSVRPTATPFTGVDFLGFVGVVWEGLMEGLTGGRA